jgi:uncharacterized membrane protein
LPLGVAFAIWYFGFVPKPGNVALGCILALVWAVLMVAVNLLLYRLRMRSAAASETEDSGAGHRAAPGHGR